MTKKDLKTMKDKYEETKEYLKKEVTKTNELKREHTFVKKQMEGSDKTILELKRALQDSQASVAQPPQSARGVSKTLGVGEEEQKSQIQSMQDLEGDDSPNSVSKPTGSNNSLSNGVNNLKSDQNESEASQEIFSKIKILDQKILDKDILLQKQEEEISNFDKKYQDKDQELVELRSKFEKLFKTNKVLSEKRKNGIKEIEKLRLKIDDMNTMSSVNSALNTSFSLEALDTKEFSVSGDIQQLGEMVHM